MNQSRQEVYSIREDTTVHEAARYLCDHKVRSVGVLDSTGMQAGVISQSDMSDKVAAKNKSPAWMRVTENITRGLRVVEHEFPLQKCLRLMKKRGDFQFLIEEESSRFLGMILVADFLQIIASDHAAHAEMIEAFAFPQI